MAWTTNLGYRAHGRKWVYNLATIKRYGDRYKLTQHLHPVKNAGLEEDKKKGPKRGPPEDKGSRLESSVSRTRAAVYEIAACNPWEFFSTWTLADDKGFSRYDLGPWYKDFSQWIRNQRRITGAPLKYLVVPECHKDGAWHLHGLWYGMPMDRLRKLSLDDFLPYRLLDKLKDGKPLYSWTAYQEKYGWCTLEPIRDKDRCATYISKYITKAFTAPEGAEGADKKEVFTTASLPPGAKLYYASQGLERAKEVWRGIVHTGPGFKWDYEGEHVKVSWGDHPGEWLTAAQMMEVIQDDKDKLWRQERDRQDGI